MSPSKTLAPPAVRWDLSALFSGIDDPKIEATWDEALKRAKAFESTYRGKLKSGELDAATLGAALREIEDIYRVAGKPQNYANLLFACNASDPKLGAFLQKQMEKGTELSVILMFAQLELQETPDAVLEPLLDDPAVANYRHYLHVVRAFKRHMLSEKEEVLLEETANTGSRAWQRLFDEVTSNHVFRYLNPETGETKELNESETLDKLRHPNRAVRQAAADTLTAGLQEIQRVLTFTFNNLLQDKNVEDRLRSYEYPEQSRHMANELDRETVDLVIRLCKERYGLVERFYRVKREILGLPKLTHIDRYAPLFESKEQVEWSRAKEIVLSSFGAFSETLEARAREFFDKNWIDAEPRKGKTGGAFCSYNTPDTHPVVFQSYMNKMDDVMTLAHELGHGVHASLSRAQTYFNFHGTLPLAELASTFGEMLVFERLVSNASHDDKLALYAEKIEGIFATVFRQAAMFSFERRAHLKRRADGEMTADEIGEIWHEELQAMFGDSVELGDQHRLWWSYVSHFVSVPFYVYAYSFGELLVLSLFQMAKAEGVSFEGKYVEMLRAGGSMSPDELMAIVGVDLHSESFWRGGFDAMEKLVVEFERLWATRPK